MSQSKNILCVNVMNGAFPINQSSGGLTSSAGAPDGMQIKVVAQTLFGIPCETLHSHKTTA
jgi:hypothetical protein